MTEIEKAFLHQRVNFLRNEMRQEEAFGRSLKIVGRWDAHRMEKELVTLVQQIAHEEIQMARNEIDSTSISSYVTAEKEKVMQYITPERCCACRGIGHENDKMVRTCGTIDRPKQAQHWHHGSCLRTNFLIATKDEQKMPPTCICGIAVPDAYGYEVLSDVEYRAYRNKREEMNTTNRTYCPVSTCSYFISPHLIERAIDDRVAEINRMPLRPNKYVSGYFQCPQCEMRICLICKQLEHPVVLPHSSMCFFKIDPKHAPLKPPGAAPTLTSLEEHYKAALAGEESGPGTALDEANPTSNSIAMSLDINDKLEPNRPVTNSSAGTAKKRKKSVPLASKVTINPR
ncbi:MAG: hypothetical protein L6R41_006410 [Letrouitia leprolyta]|nr:MAG: hypothetical protein L6R41_006410 [Letrouitia leprolyta]